MTKWKCISIGSAEKYWRCSIIFAFIWRHVSDSLRYQRQNWSFEMIYWSISCSHFSFRLLQADVRPQLRRLLTDAAPCVSSSGGIGIHTSLSICREPVKLFLASAPTGRGEECSTALCLTGNLAVSSPPRGAFKCWNAMQVTYHHYHKWGEKAQRMIQSVGALIRPLFSDLWVFAAAAGVPLGAGNG